MTFGESLHVGRILDLEFTLTNNKTIRASGRIVRSKEVIPGTMVECGLEFTNISETDQKIMDAFDLEIKDITNDMENFRFYMASEKIYRYVWHTFADIILEESKIILSGTDEEIKNSRQTLLVEILEKSLKILHPFMPFVTEEIWSMMPETTNNNKKLLMVEKWPINE